MEMLLRRRGERLETAPIKGTRPRAEDSKEDRRLAMELASDPKERAELAMVIDLERNDLGRVARVGSVEVIDPGSVRSYASVHHLVGRVQARARPGLDWWELLAAMAPGGSVTGCPKHAAMTLIRELEPVQRGPFTGAFGVVAGNGDLEMALPIRTAWRVGTTVEFAAGCGIVWESDPKREEEESRLKVARWLDLVGCGR
jgi:anthranilate/para-aminobenzoate synthase component I